MKKTCVLLVLVFLLLVPLSAFAAATATNPSSGAATLKKLPLLRFLEPAAGNTVQTGDELVIRWEGVGMSANVEAFLSRGGNKVVSIGKYPIDYEKEVTQSLMPGNPAAPTFTTIEQRTIRWTVPKNVPAAADYQIMFVGVENPNYKVLSGKFAIVIKPAISIVSPKEGDAFFKGSTCTITWKYEGIIDDTVNIYVVEKIWGLAPTRLIAQVPRGSGGQNSFSWKIPMDLQRGQYRVGVYSSQTNGISGPFMVNDLVK